MKSNSDSNFQTSSTTRNLSAFIDQAVRDTPNQEKDEFNHKKSKTAPHTIAFGRGADSKTGRRISCGRKIVSKNKPRFAHNLFAMTNNDFFHKASLHTNKELDGLVTPNKSGTNFIQQAIECAPELDLTPNRLFSLPHPSVQPNRLNSPIINETSNKTFSEYIESVIDNCPNSPPLRAVGKDSVEDWINSAVKSMSPPKDVTKSCPQGRKRKRKLVSEGFAEYIKILSRRLANDVNMWHYSVKQETQLEGVDRSEIITACVESVSFQGSLYITTCSVVEPVPDKIGENEQFRLNGRITVIFTPQTVEKLRIRPNLCVKICPPCSFLSVGDLSSPVILCTYFSFLGDFSPNRPREFMKKDPITCDSMWRSVHSQEICCKDNTVTIERSYTELDLCKNPLAVSLRSQRWEDLTLGGIILHVTHTVNPRHVPDSQATEMHLEPHFHTFVQDSNYTLCLVTLPISILDRHESIQHPYQLMNSTVVLKGLRVTSRFNRLTSPRLMSVVFTLSKKNQKYCFSLIGGVSTQVDIFEEGSWQAVLTPLTELSVFGSQDFVTEKRKRVSFVGKLLHTQLEVPLPLEDSEIEENTRPLSGCYLFLLGINSTLFQVYLEPILSSVLLRTLQGASGKLFYLGSLYISQVTERPTYIHGDEHSLLLELGDAQFLLGLELLESIRNEFRSMTPPSYPLFDGDYRLWSMVCVKGRIRDVIEESAYFWLACEACGKGVDEHSQSNELFCDECHTFVTNPINKYNLDLIVVCSSVERTELIVHLHEDTIKQILPLVGEGKVYDTVELKDKLIEVGSCFIQEVNVLPSNLTRVYLQENKHFINDVC